MKPSRFNFLDALLKKYDAEMCIARNNIEVYLHDSVGIGEHSDIMDAIEIQVRKYNDAKELYNTVKDLIDK
jgi:hypothetical protein